jgi:hypothetical protein
MESSDHHSCQIHRNFHRESNDAYSITNLGKVKKGTYYIFVHENVVCPLFYACGDENVAVWSIIGTQLP